MRKRRESRTPPASRELLDSAPHRRSASINLRSTNPFPTAPEERSQFLCAVYGHLGPSAPSLRLSPFSHPAGAAALPLCGSLRLCAPLSRCSLVYEAHGVCVHARCRVARILRRVRHTVIPPNPRSACPFVYANQHGTAAPHRTPFRVTELTLCTPLVCPSRGSCDSLPLRFVLQSAPSRPLIRSRCLSALFDSPSSIPCSVFSAHTVHPWLSILLLSPFRTAPATASLSAVEWRPPSGNPVSSRALSTSPYPPALLYFLAVAQRVKPHGIETDRSNGRERDERTATSPPDCALFSLGLTTNSFTRGGPSGSGSVNRFSGRIGSAILNF